MIERIESETTLGRCGEGEGEVERYKQLRVSGFIYLPSSRELGLSPAICSRLKLLNYPY